MSKMNTRKNRKHKTGNCPAREDPISVVSTDQHDSSVFVLNDLVITMLLDSYLDISTHKVSNWDNNYILPLHKQELRNIILNFRIDHNYSSIFKKIYNISKAYEDLPIKGESDFKNYVYMYLKLMDSSYGLDIEPCFRYSNDNYRGTKIIATKILKKNHICESINGIAIKLNKAEEENLRRTGKDFSLIKLYGGRTTSLLLGPISHVNHDCKPNSKYCKYQDKIVVKTMQDISVGEELTVYYADNYFGPNNVNCECRTCETECAGYFAKTCCSNQHTDDSSDVPGRSPKCHNINKEKFSVAIRDDLYHSSFSDNCFVVLNRLPENTNCGQYNNDSVKNYLSTTMIENVSSSHINVPKYRKPEYTVHHQTVNDDHHFETEDRTELCNEGRESDVTVQDDGGCNSFFKNCNVAIGDIHKDTNLIHQDKETVNEGDQLNVVFSQTANNEESCEHEDVIKEASPFVVDSPFDDSDADPDYIPESDCSENCKRDDLPGAEIHVVERDDSLCNNNDTSSVHYSLTNLQSDVVDRESNLCNGSNDVTHNTDCGDNGSGIHTSSIILKTKFPFLPKHLAQYEKMLPKVTFPSTEYYKNQSVESANKGRRSRRFFCPYCKKLFASLPNHLESQHKNEILPARLRNLPKKHPERTDILKAIRYWGFAVYNSNPAYNKGVLRVARRSVYSTDASEFTPCPSCCRLIKRGVLYKHYFRCTNRSKGCIKHYDLLAASKRLEGDLHPEANVVLRDRIFPILRDDDCVQVIKYDRAAIIYANFLALKFSTSFHHDKMIRGRLRLLGRILLRAKSLCNCITDLASIMVPSMCSIIIQAIQLEAGFDFATGRYDHPGTASMGIAIIKHVAELWRADCISREDELQEKKVDRLLLLFRHNDVPIINKIATENRAESQRRKKILLPSLTDLTKLANYLKRSYINCSKVLKSTSTVNLTVWKQLASSLLVYLMIYNKRRPGEIQRIQLADFNSVVEMDCDHPDFINLNQDEKALAEKYKLFLIRGKLNRSVNVLISPSAKEALQILIARRCQAGVPTNNPYAFGMPGVSQAGRWRFMDAGRELRIMSAQCGARNPALLRATLLRKLFATQAAAFNLPENVASDVADHMGHDGAIHKTIYRQPTCQRTILGVAKVLDKAMGNVDSDHSDNDDVYGLVHRTATNTGIDDASTSNTLLNDQASSSNDIYTTPTKQNSFSFKNVCSPKHRTVSRECNDILQNYHSREVKERKRWSPKQLRALHCAFGKYISTEDKALPSKTEIEWAMHQYSPLRNRNIAAVKTAVWNLKRRLFKRKLD